MGHCHCLFFCQITFWVQTFGGIKITVKCTGHWTRTQETSKAPAANQTCPESGSSCTLWTTSHSIFYVDVESIIYVQEKYFSLTFQILQIQWKFTIISQLKGEYFIVPQSGEYPVILKKTPHKPGFVKIFQASCFLVACLTLIDINTAPSFSCTYKGPLYSAHSSCNTGNGG